MTGSRLRVHVLGVGGALAWAPATARDISEELVLASGAAIGVVGLGLIAVGWLLARRRRGSLRRGPLRRPRQMDPGPDPILASLGLPSVGDKDRGGEPRTAAPRPPAGPTRRS